MPSHRTLGQLFTDRREAAGFTQLELASRAQVGVSTIYRLETDEAVPRAKNLAKLAVALDVTPEQLENYGADAAADVLRRSVTGEQRDLRIALSTLVDAEITLTKLGFSIQIWMPKDGVLMLRCEQTDTPDSTGVETKAGLPERERVNGQPPRGRRVRHDT